MNSRMKVEDGDWVPPSALKVAKLSVAEILGGMGGTMILYGSLAAFWVVTAAAVMAPDAVDAAPVVIEEEEVIAARFVRKGVDFQDQLPNRVVPQLETAPAQGQAISKRPRRREREEEEEPPPPPEATEDLLRRLGDQAQAFAEISEEREVEGDPDGIEEGTETTGTDGDRYAGQLYSFFRRGWTVPSTISDEEKQQLSVEATLTISEGLRLVSFRLRGSSGNPDFDQSVTAQLERLRAMNLEVPEPPISVRPRYLGTPFTLRFRGRQAGR